VPCDDASLPRFVYGFGWKGRETYRSMICPYRRGVHSWAKF
jgi:hypothetical protein